MDLRFFRPAAGWGPGKRPIDCIGNGRNDRLMATLCS
jgi:hypothetical protein